MAADRGATVNGPVAWPLATVTARAFSRARSRAAVMDTGPLLPHQGNPPVCIAPAPARITPTTGWNTPPLVATSTSMGYSAPSWSRRSAASDPGSWAKSAVTEPGPDRANAGRRSGEHAHTARERSASSPTTSTRSRPERSAKATTAMPVRAARASVRRRADRRRPARMPSLTGRPRRRRRRDPTLRSASRTPRSSGSRSRIWRSRSSSWRQLRTKSPTAVTSSSPKMSRRLAPDAHAQATAANPGSGGRDSGRRAPRSAAARSTHIATRVSP